MNENKEKVHYWLKQSRHLICFLVVLTFVFVYCINALADGTLSDYVDFDIRYGIEQGTTAGNLTLYNGSMSASYTAEGHNASNLSFTGFYNTSTQYSTVMGSYLLGSSNWATKWTRSNITYDFTNAYTMIGYNSSVTSTGATVVQVIGNGDICLIDRTIVSDSPFTICIMYINQTNGVWGTYDYSGIFSASSASANGYYCLDMYGGSSYPGTLKRMSNVAFTDLDIFLPSSDGVSGFTSFSTSSTDFSFDGNNFNFNYLKTGNYIVSPNDPSPLSPSLSEHYLNASMSAKVYGHCFDDVWAGFNFSLNQYQKLHPEEFTVFVSESWTVESAATGLVTYTSDDFFDMDRFVNNGLSYYSIPLDPVDFTTYVGGVLMDLDNFFKAEYANITGLSSNYYSDSNWQTSLNYRGINATFNFQDPSTPLPTVDALLTTGAQAMTKCYIDLVMQITPSDNPDSSGSGIYHYHYNFLTGESTVVQNDMPVNVNPLEGDTSGYDIISTGGGSTTNNNTNSPVAYGGNVQVTVENVAREIMQPFILEDSTVSTANIASTWNFMLHQLGDMNEDNGFWQVIIKTYEMLPSEVTTMIYAAIAAILGCAVFRFYITCIRGA